MITSLFIGLLGGVCGGLVVVLFIHKTQTYRVMRETPQAVREFVRSRAWTEKKKKTPKVHDDSHDWGVENDVIGR